MNLVELTRKESLVIHKKRGHGVITDETGEMTPEVDDDRMVDRLIEGEQRKGKGREGKRREMWKGQSGQRIRGKGKRGLLKGQRGVFHLFGLGPECKETKGRKLSLVFVTVT